MLWPAGAVRSFPTMGTSSVHMLLNVGRLFNLSSRSLFFYREDAAIPACVEHMWAGRIAQLRPRRTASHFCSIRGNPAPLTGRERKVFGIGSESAGRTPPWRCSGCFGARAGRLLSSPTVLCGTSVGGADPTRTDCIRLLSASRGPFFRRPLCGANGRSTVSPHGLKKKPCERESAAAADDDLRLKVCPRLVGPLETHRHRCVAGGPFLFALLKFCPPLLCPRL